ncbi:hypothetical protein Tco_1209184 [Tanacetum coccineum]
MERRFLSPKEKGGGRGVKEKEADGGSGSKSRSVLHINIVPTKPVTLAVNGSISFATLLKGDTSQKLVDFHTLFTPVGNGADIVASKELVYVVNE